MKTLSLLLLLSSVSASSLHAGIDFTPGTSERTLAGIKFKQLNFHEKGRTITYEQPIGWTYSGGGSGIKFIPPNVPLAAGVIEQSALPAPQAFDGEYKKTLQQRTLAAVPPSSQNAALVSDESDPILVNNNSTYEVTVSYQAFGQEFMMSVLYLNLPDTQLRFRAVAPKADFEQVHNAFRSSLLSWQWK